MKAILASTLAFVALAGPTDRATSDGVLFGQALEAAGTIRIGTPRSGSTSYDIATLAVEPYIGRVLAGEALPGSEPAALGALAIAIRTYAAVNMGRHRDNGFDLCDSTHCQVMRTATPQTEQAAQATAGQVLYFDGALATVFYSASCGGRTEQPSAVWPGAQDSAYLPSRPDDGCGGDPVWRAEIALSDLQRSFQASGYRGVLRDMRVLARNQSGRVAMLALDGLTPSQISGQDLRVSLGGTLGWQHVRSTAFELRRSRDAFRFEGRGFGHGVGMCVIGSARLAASGLSTTAILQRYYPGTDIGMVPARLAAPSQVGRVRSDPATPSQVGRVLLDPATPGSKASSTAAVPVPMGVIVSIGGRATVGEVQIQQLVARARDELAKTLGMDPPPALHVQIHDTAADFERASARPWFALGAATPGNIHLMPASLLVGRGMLETTIRRQLVHLLTRNALARRPEWVREGAALYYADNAASQSTTVANLGREPCPTDAELVRPVSPGALSHAYARALGCFARQIASGRPWKDVK
jgi:stage II sporulation protein D